MCEHVFDVTVDGADGDDPARRPRLVLRLGRTARRSVASGQTRSWSAAGWCSPPATRRRRSVCARRCRERPPGGRARTLIEVPPRFDAYTEASRQVFDIFRDTSPIVEPMSIDEAFIDVAGLWRIAGTPTEIADRTAPPGRRRCRAADQRRRGAHQVPGEGRERRREARRAAGRRARRRARLPPPAAGPAPVGRRRRDRREAARPGHPHRRRGRRDVAGRARRDRRTGDGTSAPRAGAQPRRSSGHHRQAPRIDRVSAGARSAADAPATRSTSSCGASSTA